jgi:hypothetical protein
MVVFGIVVMVFLAGCLGGVTTSLIAGGLQRPRFDSGADVYRPGWLGTCVVGGIAALTFWGLYGPLTNTVLLGGAADSGSTPVLKVGELFGSLITGMGGGRLLVSEVDRQGLKNQNKALSETRNQLADVIATFAGTAGATR